MKDQQSAFSDYSIIRDNVNNLKLIQLGLTFCKEDGTIDILNLKYDEVSFFFHFS